MSTARRPGRATHARLGDFIFGPPIIMAATGLALLAMPADPQPQGAVFWPAVCLTIGLLLVPALRVRRDITMILRAEHVLMAGLVYWLLMDLLQSAYPLEGISHETALSAFLAIGVMATGIWIGLAGKGGKLPSVVERTVQLDISTNALYIAAIFSFFLGVFYFFYMSNFDFWLVLEGLSVDRFSAPWARIQFGDWNAFVEHLQYFGHILPALVVLLAHRRGWTDVRVIVCIILAAIILLFIAQSGNRRIIGVVVGGAILTWMLLQRRITAKLIFGAGLGSGLLLYGMQEVLRYRNVGFAAWLDGQSPTLTFSHLHVDDNFLRLSQIIALFPSVHPYVWEQPALHALTLPVPRVLWPGKPVGPGYDLPQLIGDFGASLSSSIVGELYASCGLIGVFVGGLLFGRVAAMWNRILVLPGEGSRALVYGLGLMALFAGLRSMQALIPMVYGLLGWFAIGGLIGRRRNANAKAATHGERVRGSRRAG